MAVVDDELRAHALDGLRVIDASVMPAVTSTDTHAPTIIIAEKDAAMIKGAARRRMAACEGGWIRASDLRADDRRWAITSSDPIRDQGRDML